MKPLHQLELIKKSEKTSKPDGNLVSRVVLL
jgi:hypothetical protein